LVTARRPGYQGLDHAAHRDVVVGADLNEHAGLEIADQSQRLTGRRMSVSVLNDLDGPDAEEVLAKIGHF